MVCPSFLLKKPLGGYYVTNITDEWVPFTGIIEMTSLVDPSHFGGHHLVYLPKYLTQQDPFWDRSDAAIVEEFLGALMRIHPHLSPDDVLATRVGRAREVQAISTLHYSRKLKPPLETSIEGVSVVSSAQITSGTLNLNETVGLAEEYTRALIGRFETAGAARAPGARD